MPRTKKEDTVKTKKTVKKEAPKKEVKPKKEAPKKTTKTAKSEQCIRRRDPGIPQRTGKRR